MSALKAIHAKRRQAHSLQEDDDWRAFVTRHTGQTSTRGLTAAQSKALLAALDGMVGNHIPQATQISGPYAAKLQALWISCWNLGVIANKSNQALNTFAKTQAKVDHANWIREHKDAVAVIEALKKMMERAGVDWSEPHKTDPDYFGLPGYKVACAQWAKLTVPEFTGMTLAVYVQSEYGKPFSDLTRIDWISVMNNLGRKVRAQEKAA